MGRFYSLPLTPTAVTVAVDLAELLTAATHVACIHAILLGQWTELGDAAEEQLRLAFKSGQTTSGTGGNTGVTPIPRLLGDAAHGMTVESFNTTKASAGTIVQHGLWPWNVRQEFEKWFTPETRIWIPPSTRATLELVNSPADSITIGGEILIEIIG